MAITLESIINMITRKIFCSLQIPLSEAPSGLFGLTWMKPLAENAFPLISTTKKITTAPAAFKVLIWWEDIPDTDRCFINAVRDFWLLSYSGSLILYSAAKGDSYFCTKITSIQLREEPDLSRQDPWLTKLDHALFEDHENFIPVFYGIQIEALKGIISCWVVEITWLCLEQSWH